MEQDPQDSARGCCTLKVPANTNGHSNDLFPHRPQSSDQKHLIENSHVIFLGCQNLPVPLLQKRLVLMGFQIFFQVPPAQNPSLWNFYVIGFSPPREKRAITASVANPVSPLSLYELSAISSQPPSPSQLLFFWRRHRSYRAWRSYEMQ